MKPVRAEKKFKDEENPGEVVLLQNQVYKTKAIIKKLEHQLVVVKEEAQKLRSEIDMTLQMHEDIKEKDYYTRKEMAELEKRHKAEMQSLIEDYNKILYKKNSESKH